MNRNTEEMKTINYTHFSIMKSRKHPERSKWNFKLKNLTLLAMLMLGFNAFAQIPSVASSECGCLNNATKEGNGQFSETIILRGAPGVVWKIESSIGLFSSTSAAPPAAPTLIVPGTIVPETSSGVYILRGIRNDNTVWRVVVTDGTSRVPINAFHACKYPRKKIFGDFGACINSADKKYSLEVTNASIQSLTWSVSGGGSFVGSPISNPVTINWNNIPGSHKLYVNGLIKAFPNQTTVGDMCTITDTADINIVNETPVVMTCNDLVNVSLDGRCELDITPDVVLESASLPMSSFDVVLRDIQQDTIIKNGRLNMAYLNKTIEVRIVQECGGNSCWGFLKVEDKSIPQLVCLPDVTIECNQSTEPSVTGFPLSPLAEIIPFAGDKTKFTVKNFDFCSDVTLSYRDEYLTTDCNGTLSSIIRRTWSVTDISGNASSCRSNISILKASADLIEFPKNYDDVLGPNPSLQACGNFAKLADGNPSPDVTGRPTGVFCSNVSVNFSDIKLPKCKQDTNSYKIIRKWVITDLCNARQITGNQTITVSDKIAPVIEPAKDTTVSTTGLTCGGNITLAAPRVISECSSYDVVLRYMAADPITGLPIGDELSANVIKNANGTFTITQFPANTTTVYAVFYFIDACDNTMNVFRRIDVKDLTPPVPVCDEFTFVGLNNEGVGFLTPQSINDGSSDNCGIQKIEISRMENGCNTTVGFRDRIKFCCEDAGKERMVQLKVTDLAGNMNTCMTRVTVQDNAAPILENCPKNTTIDCGTVITNYAQFGMPTATDLCGVTIKDTVINNGQDECGRGSITRIFTATDNAKNTSSCAQIITVRPLAPLVASDITWPADYMFTSGGCLSNGIKPGDLPTASQRPRYPEKACAQISPDYEDLVFQYVDGFCFKILRTWTVIDWCQFDPTNPTAGKFTYTQVIKGSNNVAPTFIRGCNPTDIIVSPSGSCGASISGFAAATDDCTDSTKIIWKYELDADDNKTIDQTGNIASFSRVVKFGTHKVTWTATDECGNTKSCTTSINVQDTKKPTPYCISELVTVLMETTGSVSISAKHFARGSYDNCDADTTLVFSFSGLNPNSATRTFTCADLAAKSKTFDLNIYVYDKAGNNDYCTVKLKISDNNNKCGFGFDGQDDQETAKVKISGKIKTETEIPLKDITLKLNSDLPEFPKFIKSDAEGNYNFEQLLKNKTYTIEPNKTGGYELGLTTLDLVYIQRHILGLKKFESPYKLIAADVNSDNRISASDLVALRKVILGVSDIFPNNTPSWKFVSNNYIFADPTTPYNFEQYTAMNSLDHTVTDANFMGIKIGDINTSYTNVVDRNAEPRSNNKLSYETKASLTNGLIEVPFTTNVAKLVGMQTSMTFDNSTYEYVGFEKNSLALDNESIVVNGNLISISQTSNTPIEADEILFKLIFKVKNNLNKGNVALVSNPKLKSEFYQLENNDVITSSFNTISKQLELGGFELYQNTPNPFNNTTSIGFTIPESAELTLKIFDINGSTIKEIKNHYEKGFNTIELNATELNKTGILYYQLNSNNYSSNKKMIVIK
jgi:hypothetical protein